MNADMIKKITDQIIRLLRESPFREKEELIDCQIGYALALEDTLYSLAKIILEDAAPTDEAKIEVQKWMRKYGEKRPIRMRLGLPIESQAALVE